MDKIIEMADDKSNENIETFFKVIKGSKGEKPTTDELLELITPLIPEPIKGEDGYTPSDQELLELIIPLIPEPLNGIDGKDYILTENDKQEIAQQIPVPVVEKIIEKTEVIKEVPQEISADELLNKIESLEETLSYDKLKGKPDIDDIYKNLTKIQKQSSKTVSLQELDNVDLSNVTVTNGKYVLGSGGGGGGTIGGSITADAIAIGNGTDTITGLAGAPGNIVRFDTGSLPVISDSLIDASGASSVEFFNRILSDGGVASVNWDTRELFDSTGALAGTWSATGIELVKSLKVQGITTATIEFLNNTTSPAVSSLAVPALIDVVGGQNTLLGEPAGWVIVDTPAGAKKMPYYDL